MKIREMFASVLKALRTALGWTLRALGTLLAGICALCAVLALFGGLETESFGEQLGLFAIFLILMCVGLCVLIEGRWIKNGTFSKKPAKAVPRKVPKPKLPQPTEDQKRLEEIERAIDDTAGAIMANPMSPVSPAYEENLKKLQQEKHTQLKRIAGHSETITVQDAWNTFTPERQKRFDTQVYQYSQDVGRDGVLPREVYAEKRGLVFVDGRPVPKEVAARFEELKKAAATEKERKKNMTTLQPMDYPVPFTELLIYPNRITKRPKTAQVLHEEESGSYGSRSREAVYLFEENGRAVLVCEKQRQDEHSPQEDSEWSMRARLSLIPQPCHRIPLTKWALSLRQKDLRQYTDEVCVRTDGTPPWDEFKRYRLIKSGSMKNSHDLLGWNFTYDEIGLCFDSPGAWYLRRESHWREAPSGLPYNVTIVMKLLPGVEKKSDEELCSLLNSLPWWDPNSADRTLWDTRNWLDAEWLQKQAEFNDSMHRKHPHIDAYEKALDEVLQQLCLLEEPKPAVKEESEMKKTLTFEPTLSSGLKGYRMDMHTTSGEKYSFVLSGLVNFHPNQSSMCGYGCDDWLFHCTLDGADYILNFSDEASYGRCWRCVPISREDAQRLEQLEAADWLRLMATSGKEIHSLHPDHAAKARAAMKIDHSRCGPISDKDFYGL
ncbi:MAG: hypothetical protein E7465_00035 [Ruminococcaceae bacterium]|nr:hypothetical protein [Oscillospiraceae bacterium]